MKLGLMYVNVGPFAEAGPFLQLVRTAEECGVESIWPVEHVVAPVRRKTPYPYTDDGSLPLPDTTSLGDPLIALAVAAGATARLHLATGVLLLAQRHPLIVAKEVATLDRLSAGRVILGVGIGWLREEFDALGVPFGERSARTEEAIAALRRLWSPDPAAFEGRFWRWPAVRSHPKPVRPSGIPIVVGGCVEASARRAARLGDGFFPVQGEPGLLAGLMRALRDECDEIDRDPAQIEVSTCPVSLDPASVSAYRSLGVSRLVIAPPAFDAKGLQEGIARALHAVQGA